ncbi:hypothetical protein ACFWHQ_34880 [Streptomyces sp. NPDC060334]|uniref:hypothetical protein n=1 Tax=Streptomyces sp. NPDC060334 TaxID=3347099 RepID=UPI00364CC24D
MTTTLTPRAGKIDDIRREEEDRGYERDETDSHNQRLGRLLVRMVRDSDATIPPEHQARRTLAEMAPGYIRPPLLTFNVPVRAADEACGLCGYWTCRCGQSATVPAPPPRATGMVR